MPPVDRYPGEADTHRAREDKMMTNRPGARRRTEARDEVEA